MAAERAGGYQLVEVLVTAAVLAVVVSLATPDLLRLSGGLRVDLAARELAGVLRKARSEAVKRGVNVAVKLRPAEGERVSWTLHVDGDADGVRNRDIESGVDPQLGPRQELHHLGRHVRFGFPEGVRPRDPGDPRRRLGKLPDPIRFNRSDLASFSPFGGSTPGSLYLTDGRDHLSVVRVFGRTGKVKILRYDLAEEVWR